MMNINIWHCALILFFVYFLAKIFFSEYKKNSLKRKIKNLDKRITSINDKIVEIEKK